MSMRKSVEDSPCFSIATPTRNSLEKLRRCVGSVRGQQGASFEHVIQDACSIDGTSLWLSGQHEVNWLSQSDTGMYDAINRAWARSRGRFLSWLNSDEQYLPGTLAKVRAFFDAHPEVDVVYGDYIVADSGGWPIALRREIPFRRLYAANSFINTASCTLFFRRRDLDSGLLWLDERYRYASDMDLLLRMQAAGKVIRKIPAYLSIFGIDGSNLSTHLKMQEEVELIQKAYGAFRCKMLKDAMIVARRIERFISGGYRKENISYRYALDEVPSYLEVTAEEVGGRYNLNNPQLEAEKLRVKEKTK